MTIRVIDTHTHLNNSAFDEDRKEVLARCENEGVGVINVGTGEESSALSVAIADAHAHAWAIIGLHPIHTRSGFIDQGGEVFNPEFYRTLAQSKKVVGIGECGFDYYHNALDSYATQEEAFIAQIKLANELQLPLMIHTRDPKPGQVSPTGRSAYADVHAILKQYSKVPGNIHFYAGSYDQAKHFFDIGFTVSFTGVITFASVYEEVVRAVPLELMHAETDAPYVAPVPYRGKRAEPWQVIEVVKKIAAIKNLPLADVEAQLRVNVQKLYGIVV